MLTELRDRYGPWPETVEHLEQYGRIRIMADRLGVESIDRDAQTVVIKFRPDAQGQRLNVDRLLKVIGGRADTTLVPPATIKLDFERRPLRRPSPGHVRRGSASRRAQSAPR